MNPHLLTAQYADEASMALGRLRDSWPWLGEMLSPDVRAYRTRRPLTPDEIAARGRAYAEERQVALENARKGLKQRGRQVDAAAIAVVSARAQVATWLVRLVNDLYADLRGVDATWPAQEAMWRASEPCDWCEGTGLDIRPEVRWPADPGACTRCRGARRICRLCGTPGTCSCGRMDACVAVALDRLPALLSTIRSGLAHEHARRAARQLELADRVARSTCGLAEDRRALTAPCPACDRYELHAEITSPVHAEWTVVCVAEDCRCTGPGCPCNRPHPMPGTRHLWPARQWAGPRGLAALLGVQALVTDAVEAAAREDLHRRLATAVRAYLEAA